VAHHKGEFSKYRFDTGWRPHRWWLLVFLGTASATWYSRCMRYHKAIKVSRPEADFIVQKSSYSSLNAHVVVRHLDGWYDVRALNNKEVDEFITDLLRTDMANATAGRDAPH
jgi:hypothetical protein